MHAIWPLYAMDTCFYTSLGSYELDARCEILRELGYDGTYLTLFGEQTWDDLTRLADVAARNGLAVAGIWASLDIASADAPQNVRLLDSAELFAGFDRLELAVGDTTDRSLRWTPDNDDTARELVAGLAERLPDGVQVCLYPHVDAWLETFEATVQLCERIDHERVGVCFPAYHWFASDSERAEPLLQRAGARLRSVNICGSRRLAGGGAPTIEPLDEGELDNFALLGALRRAGYEGMVGLQGYSVGGDVYGKLQRSLAAYRSMVERLAAHPEWAVLRP